MSDPKKGGTPAFSLDDMFDGPPEQPAAPASGKQRTGGRQAGPPETPPTGQLSQPAVAEPRRPERGPRREGLSLMPAERRAIVRHTYYIYSDQQAQIAALAADTRLNDSDIVRRLLDFALAQVATRQKDGGRADD